LKKRGRESLRRKKKREKQAQKRIGRKKKGKKELDKLKRDRPLLKSERRIFKSNIQPKKTLTIYRFFSTMNSQHSYNGDLKKESHLKKKKY